MPMCWVMVGVWRDRGQDYCGIPCSLFARQVVGTGMVVDQRSNAGDVGSVFHVGMVALIGTCTVRSTTKHWEDLRSYHVAGPSLSSVAPCTSGK